MEKIPGFKDYYITTEGEVYNIKTGKFRRFTICRGYYSVFLRPKSFRVNRLVALAFIPNPENKPEVSHLDLNPLNNKVENLAWATRSENIQHGWHSKGKMVLDLSNGIFYNTVKEAAESKDINPSTLKCSLNGHYKKKFSFTYC